MLLMVKKESQEEHVIKYIDMQKQIINIWKVEMKMKNQHVCSI